MLTRILMTGLAVLGLSLTSTSATAQMNRQSAAELCHSLDRSNVDCACVAKKVEVFNTAAETPEIERLLLERYAFSVGQPNDMMKAEEAFMSNERQAIIQITAFERLGGMPGNIEDFEEGCIKTDADNVTFRRPREGSQAALYVEDRTIRVGKSDIETTVCVANKIDSRLSEAEFEAYRRSYSGAEGDTIAAMDRAAARRMGVSTSRYQRLKKSARQTLDQHGDRDERICGALTWGNSVSEEQNEKARRAFETMREAETLDKADMLSGDDVTKAWRMMETSCTAEGNSDNFCQCKMRDFETKVVARAPRPGVTLAWAMMQSGAGLPDEALMELQLSIPPQDMQDAGRMLMSTMDVGETCTQGVPDTPAEPMKGTPRERMTAICRAENNDAQSEQMCECMTDQMEDRFSEDDFELMVDLREADFQGAEDPLAKVAEDRGLTAQEAEAAIMANQSLVASVMGMNMMTCMGNMPSLGGMPGFPGLPQQ